MQMLGVLAAALLLLVALAWFFQRRMIYFPLEQRVAPVQSVLAGAEEVVFETEDGLRLQGWFVPAGGGPARATVLVFNGNAGNRSYRAPLAAFLARRGYAVLLFDYRGYGGNPGRPSERGLLADGRAARAWLESRPDVDPRRLVLFGESLGAAVALAGASERPPAALVLRSPFTSLTDVGRRHYPFLPVRWLLADRYPSLERITGLDCPLLVVAGERDRIVPIDQSRTLFETAPVSHKRFLSLPGGHNDFELLAGDRLVDAMIAFMEESLAPEES
jgi:fermentation-respiration switch protein FrsA (DUF1100 family)